MYEFMEIMKQSIAPFFDYDLPGTSISIGYWVIAILCAGVVASILVPFVASGRDNVTRLASNLSKSRGSGKNASRRNKSK